MCEENMNMEVENQEGVQEVTLDELLQNASQGEIVIPPVELDIENLKDIQINKKEFQAGIKDGSRLAGYITALKNVGFDNESVLSLLLNKDNIDHNIKIAEINNEANIEISKNQQNVASGNTL